MQQPQQPTGGGASSGPSAGGVMPEGSAAATAYAQHFAAQQALAEDLDRFWEQVRCVQAAPCKLCWPGAARAHPGIPCGMSRAESSRGACLPPTLPPLQPLLQAQGEVEEHSEVLADFKAQALPLARIKKVWRWAWQQAAAQHAGPLHVQSAPSVLSPQQHPDRPAPAAQIMKSDEDVRMISAEAPVLFARACEFFIQVGSRERLFVQG